MMGVPFTKLSFEDLYRFLVSAGIIVFLFSTLAFIASETRVDLPFFGFQPIFKYAFFFFLLCGLVAIVLGLWKWNINQKRYDEKLKISLEMDRLGLKKLKEEIVTPAAKKLEQMEKIAEKETQHFVMSGVASTKSYDEDERV